jgi:hypothetical protein
MNRRELFPILGVAVPALEAAEYKPRLLSEPEYAMVTSLANLIRPNPTLTSITLSSRISHRLADTTLEATEYEPRLLSEREYAMVTSLANLILPADLLSEKNPTLTNITLSPRTSHRLTNKFKRGELKRV